MIPRINVVMNVQPHLVDQCPFVMTLLREGVEENLLQRAMTCTIVTFCRRTKKLTMLLMLLIDEGTAIIIELPNDRPPVIGGPFTTV